MKKKSKWFPRILKIVLITGGSLFTVFIILAFTTLPFWALYSLGTSNSSISEPPATIVMLGGNGIPSSDGLLRTFYTAKFSLIHPEANIIIAIPGNPSDSADTPNLIKDELIMRGVNPHSISFNFCIWIKTQPGYFLSAYIALQPSNIRYLLASSLRLS